MLATPSDPAATTRCHCRGGSGVSTRRFRGIAHQPSPAWRRAATLRSGGLASAQVFAAVWRCQACGVGDQAKRGQCAGGAFEPSLHVNTGRGFILQCHSMFNPGQDTRNCIIELSPKSRVTQRRQEQHTDRNTTPHRLSRLEHARPTTSLSHWIPPTATANATQPHRHPFLQHDTHASPPST